MSTKTYVYRGNPGYSFEGIDGPLDPGDHVELTAEQAAALGARPLNDDERAAVERAARGAARRELMVEPSRDRSGDDAVITQAVKAAVGEAEKAHAAAAQFEPAKSKTAANDKES